MGDCKKCGSTDVLTTYVKQGKLINSSSNTALDDEFTSSSEYDYCFKLTAKKEHLHKHCRNCQFDWNENVINTG